MTLHPRTDEVRASGWSRVPEPVPEPYDAEGETT